MILYALTLDINALLRAILLHISLDKGCDRIVNLSLRENDYFSFVNDFSIVCKWGLRIMKRAMIRSEF